MPLLAKAARVTVAEVERREPCPGRQASNSLNILERNGVRASLSPSPQGPQHHGRDDPAHAGIAGLRPAVKGAYTQSRLRQMMFGGATGIFWPRDLAGAHGALTLAH